MKTDFLKECMSDIGIVPINDFTKKYCLRCVNPDCSRSSSNNHLFVQRTSNWEDTLFKNVERASDSDPRYVELRSKLFTSRNQPLGEISVITPPEVMEVEELIEEKSVEVEPEVTESEPPIEPTTVEELPKRFEPSVVQQEVKNTDFQQGMMLNESSEKIVPIGGTFILDDE